MKILFLDIDGVCNSEESFRKDPNHHFPIDSYMAFLVGKIKLDTGCEVVLSSSWRHHNESVDQIRQRIVPLYDLTGSKGIDPTRPPGIENCLRGREIQAWLDNHKYKVERYAILDDENDMLPEQQTNFFKTSWKTGLTKEIADKVIEHLNSL